MLGQFVHLNALIFLRKGLESIFLLDPLYFLVVVLAARNDGSFKFWLTQDWVPGVMQVDNIVLYLREEEADLQHPRKNSPSEGCRVVNIWFVVLPQYSLVFGWQFLGHPLFGGVEFLAVLKLHEGKYEYVVELFDDPVALDEELPEICEEVYEVALVILLGPWVVLRVLEIFFDFELLIFFHIDSLLLFIKIGKIGALPPNWELCAHQFSFKLVFVDYG